MSEENGYAGKDAFMGTGRRYKDAEIPGIGIVRIRSMTARESAYVQDARETEGPVGINKAFVKMITLCVVDSEGNPIFTEADRQMLLDMDNMVAQHLVAACLDHEGAPAESLEEVAKN